jgi:hypothetical protein
MSNPMRWLDDPATPEELRALLRACPGPSEISEATLSRSRRRVTFLALVPVSLAGLFTSKAVAASILAIATLSVGAAAVNVVRTKAHHEPQNAPIIVSPAPVQTVDRPAPAAVKEIDAPVLEPTAPPPTKAAPRPMDRASPPRETHASDAEFLEEVAILQTAQGLVDVAPRQALDNLQLYREKYPTGRLRLEASVLEIEALFAAGEREEARAQRSRIESSVRGSIYERRLNALDSEKP